MDLLGRLLNGEFKDQPEQVRDDIRILANDTLMSEAERTARLEEVLKGWSLKDQRTAEFKHRRERASSNGDEPHDSGDGLPVPVDWKELFDRPITTEEWLVDDFWPAGRSISVVARVKGGKSLLMFYLCACLARGIDPWTLKAREPVTVGYWDMEMTEDDLHERAEDFGLRPEELERFKYYLLPTIPPIDTPEGGKAVLGTLQRDGVQATVFDTFGRVVGGDENLADTVNTYYRWTGLPLKVAGIASARLDHIGHTNVERARGSSGKGADVDVAWTLSRGDDSTVLLDHHGVSRVRWVPRLLTVSHTRHSDDTVPDRYERAEKLWPAGTVETAGLLDLLKVPLDATVKDAAAELKRTGSGRRTGVVANALNWRRTRWETPRETDFGDEPETLWETDDENDF